VRHQPLSLKRLSGMKVDNLMFTVYIERFNAAIKPSYGWIRCLRDVYKDLYPLIPMDLVNYLLEIRNIESMKARLNYLLEIRKMDFEAPLPQKIIKELKRKQRFIE
jgi:hypothetical protein